MANDIFYIKLSAWVTASFVFVMVFFHPTPYRSSNAYGAFPFVVALKIAGPKIGYHLGGALVRHGVANPRNLPAVVSAGRALTPAVRNAMGQLVKVGGPKVVNKFNLKRAGAVGLIGWIMAEMYGAEWHEEVEQGSESEPIYDHDISDIEGPICLDKQCLTSTDLPFGIVFEYPEDYVGRVCQVSELGGGWNAAGYRSYFSGKVVHSSGPSLFNHTAFNVQQGSNSFSGVTFHCSSITDPQEVAIPDGREEGYYDSSGQQKQVPADPVTLGNWLKEWLENDMPSAPGDDPVPSDAVDLETIIDPSSSDVSDISENMDDTLVTPDSLVPPSSITDPETGQNFDVPQTVYNEFKNYFDSTEYTEHNDYTENYNEHTEVNYPEADSNIDYQGPIPDVGDPAQVPEFDPSIDLPDKEDIPYQSWIDSVPFVGLLSDSGVELENPNSVVEVPLNFPGLPDAEGVASFDFAEYSDFFQMMGSIIFAVSSFIALRWALGV